MINSLHRISSLSRLIILDGLRRNALIWLILFALAGTTGGLLFFDFIPRDIGRAANDFIFSIIWLTGLIFLLFHCVKVTAWDEDQGALFSYMARPISRTEYALSLFTGLAILLLMLNIVLGIFGWMVLKVIKSSVGASYFQHLSFLLFLLAEIGMYWIQLMLLSIILLFSSSVRGSFPVLLLTLCYYFICNGLPVVRESFKQKSGTDYNHVLDNTLKWLTGFFPDLSSLDFKNLVITSYSTPHAIQFFMPFAQSTLYFIVVLWLACIIYERRDLQ